MLKLFWFGFPLVQEGQRSIKFGMRKATALLAYLSLAQYDTSREVLATMFWPEYDQVHALANLRRVLSSLVRALPMEILEANRETIHWRNTADLWVDVYEFRQILKKVNTHCADELCEECLKELEQAADLYRGEFLESLNLKDCPEFDDWQSRQRQEHQQAVGSILKKLAEEHSRHGQVELGLKYARRWVALDRMNELAQRCQIRLLLQSGQRSEARREYEGISRFLREQFDQVPDAETQSLYKQIEGVEISQRGAVNPSNSSVSFPIIKTKLYIPTPPTRRVIRSRLLDLLNQAQEKSLTVISAPAGSGKTTLLAEWIVHTSLPIAWLSLDHGDNDPYRFLSYLITSFEGIHEDIGKAARQFLQMVQPIPPHIIIDSLISDLGAIVDPFALVLDDYQFITALPVHEVVNYFLDHLPSNLHLVVSTRSDPPFHLARLRASDRVLEIRTTDIRFDFDEAVLFLNEVMGLNLSNGDIEVLELRTEGWIVGLKMAALSLQGKINPGEMIKTFSGSNRFILDYLVDEVLKQQPEHIRKFLIYTSVLDRMCGELCGIIVNRAMIKTRESESSDLPSTQGILEHLEEANLFVVPLDDERRWYRFHHLFADLLRSYLQHQNPDVIPDLHNEASIWYESKYLMEEAIHHALIAHNYDRAASIINKISENVWLNGEYYKLLRWLREFPKERIRDYPWLCLWYAWSLTQTGPLQEARSWVDTAEQGIEDRMQKDPSNWQDDYQALREEIASFRVTFASLEQDYETALKLALPIIDQPMTQDRITSRIARANIFHGLSTMYYVRGEFEKAEHFCEETIQITQEIGFLIRYIPAYNKQAHIYRLSGRLHQSHQILSEQLELMRRQGEGEHYTMGNLYCRLADINYEWNRLDDVQYMLNACQDLNKVVQVPYLKVDVLNAQGRLFLIQKDFDGAQACLSQAADLINKYYCWPQLIWENESYQVKLWIAMGDLKSAVKWAEKNSQTRKGEISFAQETIEISRARIYFSLGDMDHAIDLLERLKRSIVKGGRLTRLIEILVMKACVLEEKGNVEEAYRTLMKALDRARTEEYLRTFLDEGNIIKEMIERIYSDYHGSKKTEASTQFASYLGRLLTAFSPNPLS